MSDQTAEESSVLVERRVLSEHAHVLVIRFNRPDRLNAVNDEMVNLYFDALQAANADPLVRSIIVTGAGRAFCAGADTTGLGKLSEGNERVRRERRHWLPLTIEKPIIAAVNGPCIGLGFVMATFCDFRFTSADVKIGPGFSRLGLPAENGLAWLLPRQIGYSKALKVLMSPTFMDGREAHDLGVVDGLFEPERLLDGALEFADNLAIRSSPQSLAAVKRLVVAGFSQTFQEADRAVETLMPDHLGSADFKEGLLALREGRPPKFIP